MIRALTGPEGSAAGEGFFRAAAVHGLPGVELSAAWHTFGKDKPAGAGGWYFFTAGEGEEPFALALRGGAAWACGAHDPEELGEFLRYVGAGRITARTAPGGFARAERMLGYRLPSLQVKRAPAGTVEKRPGLLPVPGGYGLSENTDAARIAAFLRQEGAFAGQKAAKEAVSGSFGAAASCVLPGELSGAERQSVSSAEEQAEEAAGRLFAREQQARIAAGLGYSAVLSSQDGEIAAVMTVTTAPQAKTVCLSALQVKRTLRGRGLGGWLVRALAAKVWANGLGVCLLCRPERAGFYERLGFVPEGEYGCFVPE